MEGGLLAPLLSGIRASSQTQNPARETSASPGDKRASLHPAYVPTSARIMATAVEQKRGLSPSPPIASLRTRARATRAPLPRGRTQGSLELANHRAGLHSRPPHPPFAGFQATRVCVWVREAAAGLGT